jgi:hypothetical protein
MKRFYHRFWLLPLAPGLFFNTNCEPIGESTVGSPSDTEISRVAFVVDTTYIGGSLLYAKGRVQNTGPNTISPTWYVEAQFYTDATYTTKLGGNYTSISVPLGPGQSTFWTISFSSSNVDVRKFPDFRVRDLRAIYKN